MEGSHWKGLFIKIQLLIGLILQFYILCETYLPVSKSNLELCKEKEEGKRDLKKVCSFVLFHSQSFIGKIFSRYNLLGSLLDFRRTGYFDDRVGSFFHKSFNEIRVTFSLCCAIKCTKGKNNFLPGQRAYTYLCLMVLSIRLCTYAWPRFPTKSFLIPCKKYLFPLFSGS